MSLEKLLYPALLKIEPEKAHRISKWGIRHKIFAPGKYETQESKTWLFGMPINNPLGVAAGFDKNGEISEQMIDYGFGWVEVGSITYKGSKGNKKPRLFRLEDGSLLNKIGLNGQPAHRIMRRLKRVKKPFAINVAKTPRRRIIGDKAIEDIENTYKLAKKYLEPFGKLVYIAFNVSCPNAKDGKTFEQEPKSLDELLKAINEHGKVTPRLLKVSPNLSYKQMKKVIEISDDRVDGYICGNTLLSSNSKYGEGGFSGPCLRYCVQNSVRHIGEFTKKPIIVCGGISTGKDAQILKTVNPNIIAFQVYTAFVYRHKNNPYAGPCFAHHFLNEFFSFQRTHKQKTL